MACLALGAVGGSDDASAQQTSLDSYVGAPDASYDYNLIVSVDSTGYTAHLLHVESQTWRSPSEVNRTLWEHYLIIIEPDVLQSSTALLRLYQGDNNDPQPSSVDPMLLSWALETGAIVAEILTIPNQTLQFAGESFTRSEDWLLAKTFRMFLDTGDTEWPGLLPMVKSGVRGMDTVQDFLLGIGVTVDGFVVMGGSKRGWTALLVAAVDERVIAIAPRSFDALNLDDQLIHHRRAYEGITADKSGDYAAALHEYVVEGIADALTEPEGQPLIAIVDPFEYRDRLVMPKYFVLATGDEFFYPESSRLYFHDLPGQKHMYHVPNVGHSLDEAAKDRIGDFFNAVVAGDPFPEFSWSLEADSSIRVVAVDSPLEVKLWQATNPQNRDFRITTFGPQWSSSPVRPRFRDRPL